MQIISIKTKLVFKNETDKSSIIETLKSARDVWNFISEQHFSVNEQGWLNCRNNIVELHASVYKKCREKFDINSNIISKTENEVLSSYRTIKKNKQKPHGPAVKKKLSLRLNKNSYSYKNMILSLVSMNNRVKCNLQLFSRLENFLSKYKHGDPTILFQDNEVWISLPFKIEIEQKPSNLACGIDLGICRFAATSEGKLFKSKKFLAEKRRLRHLKSKLQSKKTKSARRHLKKIRHKERNINLNFNHHLANSIVQSTKANVLVLEDLEVAKMKKKTKYDKTTNKEIKIYGSKNHISQVSMGELRFFITYKAKLAGKSVLFINPAYTSQTDSLTGKRDGERVGRRYYTKSKYGKSGLVYDSDVNASVNIAKLSKLPISQARLLDGQGLVIDPIVC